jgi:signal transduction histidine kinase
LELQAQTAKGNVLWVYTNGRANYQNGKVVTLSGTIQDIDASKKAEEKYNLEKQKSIQSAKLASLGELAASMAHEINNPLGIISGYTELMLMTTDLPDAMLSKLNVILNSCERIAHIVNNLKKFSRIETAKEHSQQNLTKIINEAISLARPR